MAFPVLRSGTPYNDFGMVTRERLNKLVRRHCREIRQQVKEYCSTRNGEALHQLRVEVKKLRALLALLQGCTAHHPNAKGLKEVYRAAGAIRTAQINGKILQERGLENRAFVQEQARLIEAGTASFCHAAQRYRQDVHAVQKALEQDTADIKPQQVRRLFAARIQKLSLFFSAATLDTVALHDTRKETKELMYMYALLPSALAASLPLNKDYLDELQHRLGAWHDNAVILSLLQGFSTTEPALLEKLHEADAALLSDIRELTTGFAEKISRPSQGGTLPEAPVSGAGAEGASFPHQPEP